MRKKPALFTNRSRRFRTVSLVFCLVVLAGAGLYTLQATRAAGPFIATEAESGTITAPAAKVTDTSASGGQSVSFAAVPPPSPSAWPDATNTGVAGCPALTLRTTDLRITTSNTIIQNLELRGQLTIADGVTNVTVRCVKVVKDHMFPVDTERSGITGPGNVLFENVEVDCTNSAINHAGMLLFGTTVRKARVYGCMDAYRWDSHVILEDSLCHNLSSRHADPHYDCAQTGGADNVVIRHNTFIGRDTSDVAIWPDLGPVNNVLVENNRLLGNPGYLLYVGKNDKSDPVTNVTIRNNRFARTSGYGPCSIENANPTWTGNVWDDNGAALLIGQC